MNDEEIIREFISLEAAPGGFRVMVIGISWDGPATPISRPVQAEFLEGEPSVEERDAAIRRALRNRRFFRICQECGERNPCGWMSDERICQGCAERNHGVVY